MSGRELPFPHVGYGLPSTGELKHWQGIPRSTQLTSEEVRALQREWAAAMRAEGFEQVWVDFATGRVAATDAGSLRIGDGVGRD